MPVKNPPSAPTSSFTMAQNLGPANRTQSPDEGAPRGNVPVAPAHRGLRQAVVVIHGIGEQRPMGTLRGFVDAVLPDPASRKGKTRKPKFWSKPDRMSETLELKKLTAPQTRSQPPTDFFEFYWAYQAQGTKYAHVVAWLWTVL